MSAFLCVSESTQLVYGSITRHGDTVAASQHTRLELCEYSNGLFRRLPLPGRVSRRAGNSLLAAVQTPQQKSPERAQVDGQKSVARDQGAVTLSEEGDMARRVAGRRNAFPVGKTWNTSTWIEWLHYILKAGLREHRLDPPARHHSQQRKDDPAIEGVGIPPDSRKIFNGREGQFVRMHENWAIPQTDQLTD
jgi:hypothetical protein